MGLPRRVNETTVLQVPRPEATATWNPVSHKQLIYTLEEVARNQNVSVIDRKYTLNNDGKRLFGTWILEDGNEERSMIGFRNSVDASMSLGLCSGLYVMVCSNMAFSGDYKIFRKHTIGLTDEVLFNMATNAWKATEEDNNKMRRWHQALHNYRMNELEIEAMSYRAIRAGVITVGKLKNFIDVLADEIKIAQDLTLHTFHGGVTRMIRSDSLFSIADATPRLRQFCDLEMAEMDRHTEQQISQPKKGWFKRLFN